MCHHPALVTKVERPGEVGRRTHLCIHTCTFSCSLSPILQAHAPQQHTYTHTHTHVFSQDCFPLLQENGPEIPEAPSLAVSTYSVRLFLPLNLE